ncbi:MAG: hypothetical protein JXB50_03070 [Spirochaetes bacterium]|nr:hypothetical protein [Spirochaetota bacterium]
MAIKKQIRKKIISVESNNNIFIPLEKRDDLFNRWIIRSWFSSRTSNDAVKIIFLELFMGLYDDLSEKFNDRKRDETFINFINIVFPTVLDVYKWHESEKAQMDIGLLTALNSISICDWYIELLSSYSKMYNGE